ncbi:Rpn family recombination-promoting nuclease/putative transposase [Aeribacillus sp. FSL K6-8210]|uniref:Rpn family recombination-promoting nuclease/putative transposase n=2 Tax=Aeribacillus sp. FSL K6-8210 TaxID=2954683 RepID=UPI0030CE8E0A
MMKEYLDLKLDFMFKQLFGHPSRKQLTIAFLNAVLHRTGHDRIIDVQFDNTELAKEFEEGKMNRLDVLVWTDRGERINVEIQIIDQHDMPERILYYWARLFSQSLFKGQGYSELPPTIMIAILNYPLFPHETDRFHTIFHIREDEEQFLWSAHLEFHAIDLSQFMVKWKKYRRDVKRSSEWPWLMMLSAVDARKQEIDETILKELEVLAMNEQEIREALEEWEKLSVSSENRYAYEMRLKWLRDQLSNLLGERRAGMEEGLEKGLKQGLKQGREEERKNLIQHMSAKGMAAKDIADLTGLAEEEVRKWLK